MEALGARTREEGRRLCEPAGDHQARLPRVARAPHLAHAVRQARVKHGQPVKRWLDRGDLCARGFSPNPKSYILSVQALPGGW